MASGWTVLGEEPGGVEPSGSSVRFAVSSRRGRLCPGRERLALDRWEVAMSKGREPVAEAIAEFRGCFRFLSNFWSTDVWFEGISYPSLEHAFQAAKTLDAGEREWIRRASSPQAAKRRGGRRGEGGRRITLRADWEGVKVGVMRELIAIKFAHGGELAALLLATAERELVEGNWWGDRFWGVCGDCGENWLGRLLMERRAALRLDD